MKAQDKLSQTQATLKASELVSKQVITTAVKLATPQVATILDNHANPDKTDCQSMQSLMTSRDGLARIMAAMDWKPSELVSNLFHFRSTHKPQRSTPNEYMPLKSFPKLDALCCAMLLGDASVFPNVNKYLTTILALSEATEKSEIANSDVYSLYCANQTRVDAILDGIENPEYRAILKNRSLWKSPSTASTQRPTSAWLLHLLGAGENRGNDRTIVVDRSSDAYKSLCRIFLS